MNKDLPVVTGTNRKPVNYVLPLSDGRVAVCTGEYLLIWSGEERKEQRTWRLTKLCGSLPTS